MRWLAQISKPGLFSFDFTSTFTSRLPSPPRLAVPLEVLCQLRSKGTWASCHDLDCPRPNPGKTTGSSFLGQFCALFSPASSSNGRNTPFTAVTPPFYFSDNRNLDASRSGGRPVLPRRGYVTLLSYPGASARCSHFLPADILAIRSSYDREVRR